MRTALVVWGVGSIPVSLFVGAFIRGVAAPTPTWNVAAGTGSRFAAASR